MKPKEKLLIGFYYQNPKEIRAWLNESNKSHITFHEWRYKQLGLLVYSNPKLLLKGNMRFYRAKDRKDKIYKIARFRALCAKWNVEPYINEY